MTSAQRSVRDDLERAILLLKRSTAYWKRSLAIVVIGMLIAVPIIFTRPRTYRSEMVILYQETMRASDVSGGETGDGNSARRVGPRLREVLFSRASLEPIIKDLNLSKKAASDPRVMIEEVEDMRKKIIFRAREGDTFEIAYDASTPEEAQAVTQRLGDCIILEASQRRAERAQVLKDFLNTESQQNATDLRAKEAAMAAFESQHPALAMRMRAPSSVQTPPPGPGGAAQPTSGDPILASLEAQAARIDRQLAKARGAAPPPPPPPLPVFTPPPDSGELIAARRDLADKLAKYTDRHPDVIAARARLKAAEEAQAAVNQQALDAHAAAVASAKAAAAQRDEPAPKTAADEAVLRQQLIDIQTQAATRRAQLRGDAGAGVSPAELAAGSNVALEVEFRRLDRDLNEARERQRQLDDRLFKASIQASSVMSDRNIQVTVLDPAYLPLHPISNSRTGMVAAALVALLVLALAVAIVSTKFDDRIYDKVDLERLDILPIVGVIPAPQLAPSEKRPNG